ncbi:hypothetical protein NUACC21_10930 [Scytonema sp. NUACC21]
MGLVKALFALQKQLYKGRKELLTASGVAMCILLLRSIGFLQSLEWAALDYFFQLRPQEASEERITIVAIDEASLRYVRSWPIPDRQISQLIQKLKDFQDEGFPLIQLPKKFKEQTLEVTPRLDSTRKIRGGQL